MTKLIAEARNNAALLMRTVCIQGSILGVVRAAAGESVSLCCLAA